jgi:hypothetical protein
VIWLRIRSFFIRTDLKPGLGPEVGSDVGQTAVT